VLLLPRTAPSPDNFANDRLILVKCGMKQSPGYSEPEPNSNMNPAAVPQRMPKSARTQAARRAVSETTELLEAILLSLPPRDTIVCMRVCKRWNECVHASPSMPRHLFLRPSETQVQQVILKSDEDPDENIEDYFA